MGFGTHFPYEFSNLKSPPKCSSAMETARKGKGALQALRTSRCWMEDSPPVF